VKLPNWFDLILITLFFKGCYSGFGRGFLTELLHLAGLVLATVVAINFYGTASQWLSPLFWFGHQTGVFLTFLIIFLAMVFGVSVLTRALGRALQWERMNLVVQGLGLLIGGVRGLWICGLIAVIMTSSGIPYLRHSVEQESLLGRRLHDKARMVFTQVTARAPGGESRDPRLVPKAR